MDEPTVLRTTKIGGGFVKEDVLTYLDELNSKISGLEEELKQAKESGPADPQELLKYRNQVDNLQEKLNASNNALRAAKKENEDLQKKLEESEKVIAQLRTGGAAPAAHAAGAQMSAQTQAALEAAKKEIDKLRAELKAANDKAAAAPAAGAPANAQITAALEAAKKEIDSLRGQLKTANDKLAAAEKAAAAHTDKAAPAGDPAAEAELVKAKQDIAKLTSDLEAKTAQLEAKIKEASETEGKIAELNKAKESAVADAVAKKDDEIKNLNKEIEELKANASNPAAMMGTLFAEAQKTVDSLKKQAEEEANTVTKEAKDKADKVVSEAQANADKTVREANEKADKTLKEATDTAAKTIKEANETAEMTVAKANAAAEKTIKDANDQAKSTVDDANSKADKINAMSSTVRLMLVNEIESVNSKFADIKSAMAKLTSQATDRMDEAQNIIGEARNSIEPEDKATVERASAPQAAFEATKAPSGATPTFEPVSAKDGKNSVADEAFARVSGGSYNNGGNNKPAHNNNNNNNNNSSGAPEQKAAPKKNNFSFDMSDLLKAAEEEAAKESE